jgi:hypothetical protein
MRGIVSDARQFHRMQDLALAPRLEQGLSGPRPLQPLQLHDLNRWHLR